MPLIPFPNVPSLPGVPVLARVAGAVKSVNSLASNALSILTGDDPLISSFVQPPRWGIFTDAGDPVAEADSTVAFDHAKEWRVSDFPVEDGKFASFNKVRLPYEQHAVLAKSGSEDDRAAFLNAIDDAADSTDLYTVVTPEVTYVNASIVRYDFRRTNRNGVTLLIVDLTIREIRVTAAPTFSNTASPSGATQTNGGTVQAQAPSATQTTTAAAGAT